MTIWDGNVVSKSARDSIVRKGLACRWNGWQVITREGYGGAGYARRNEG